MTTPKPTIDDELDCIIRTANVAAAIARTLRATPLTELPLGQPASVLRGIETMLDVVIERAEKIQTERKAEKSNSVPSTPMPHSSDSKH